MRRKRMGRAVLVVYVLAICVPSLDMYVLAMCEWVACIHVLHELHAETNTVH